MPRSRRPRRGDMSFGEFCGKCCCECGKACLIHVLIGFITAGIIVFILWLALRPKAVKFYITDASLSEFDYENNTLHYDLALNFSFQNHNRRMGVHYDYIEVQTLFQNVRFNLETLAPFYQGHKNTTVLSHVFKGQQLLVLTADQASELGKEKSRGVYDIQVPLTSSNNGISSAGAFQTTKCKGDLSYGYLDAVH